MDIRRTRVTLIEIMEFINHFPKGPFLDCLDWSSAVKVTSPYANHSLDNRRERTDSKAPFLLSTTNCLRSTSYLTQGSKSALPRRS